MNTRGGIALIGLLVLTGCASAPATLTEDEYFDLVRETDALSGLQDEDIRNLGETICGVFDTSDNPYVDTLSSFKEQGMLDGAGALIAFSVTQYCPEHIEAVPRP